LAATLLAATAGDPGQPASAGSDSDIEEIRVTGTTQESLPDTASVTWIGRDELLATPVRGAEDALRLVPGFLLVQHGTEGKGQQFFLRGFDAGHGTDIEVLVDGILVNEASHVHAHGYLDLGFVIPELVRSVKVTKGPFSVAQGPFAMAATAEYRLGLAPGLLGWRAGYTAGTTGRHRLLLSFAPEEGDGDDFIAVEVMHDDGFGQNRESERAVLLGRWNLLDSSVRLTAGAHAARFELPGVIPANQASAGGIGFFDTLYRNGYGESARGFLALDYSGDALKAAAHLAYRHSLLNESFTGYLEDPTAGDGRRQAHAAWYASARVRCSHRFHDDVSVAAGAGGHLELFGQGETSASGERSGLRGGYGLGHANVESEWTPLPQLRLRGGARLDLVGAALSGLGTGGPLVAVSPRLTAAVALPADLHLVVSYGRGVRPPEARAFFENDADRLGFSEEDAQVNPGRLTLADVLEVGARYTASRMLRLAASGFLTRVDRESVFDHVSGTNLELNATRRTGAELVAVLQPLSWLILRGDVAVVDARFVESGRQVPFAPWLVGSAGAVVRHESGLRCGVRFLGAAPRPLPHGARGSTLTMVDAAVGWETSRFRIDLELENLLDSRIRAGEYHFASHWRVATTASELPELHYVAAPPFNARLTVTAQF
jgi:hypothetical protein